MQAGKHTSRARRWRHAFDLVVVLIGRDLKVLYKRSSLGIGWALVMPLLQLLIFTFVFRRAFSIEIPNYPLFVFVGILVFGWFQSSLAQCAGTITASKALVTQPGFPLTLLPHVTVAVRLFHLGVALPILMGMLLLQGGRPAWAWLALPLLIATQYLLIIGLAYPLAALNVVFRDTQHIASVLLQLLLYLTPVFYSLEMVPEELRAWYHLNPLVGLVQAWRDVLLLGRWPDAGVLGVTALVGAVLVVVGQRIFVRQSHRFVEEL